MSGKERIEARLLPQAESPKMRQVQLSIRQDYLERLTDVAKVMTALSGRTVSRHMLIGDAVEAFVLESSQYLDGKG